MNTKRIATRLFRVMLRTYPQSFQLHFGDEMEETFASALEETKQQWTLALIFHELADWPGALLREHWAEWQRKRKEVLMSEMVSSMAGTGGGPGNGGPSQTGSWGEARRAGLPHLLALVFAGISMLMQNAPFLADEHGVGTFVSGTLAVLMWVVGFGVLGRSLWRAYKERWPGWSASWGGYLFVLVAAPMILFLQETSFTVALGLDQFFSLAVLPVVLAGLLYFLARKDWIKMLLVATPFAILLWMPMLEFVPNPIRHPLNLWILVVIAGVSMAIVRMGNWQKGVWWMFGGSVLVGLPVAYARTYHPVYPGWTVDQATLLVMANMGLNTLFWSGVLIFGPVLLGVLRKEGLEMEGQGKIGVRMMLGGFWLNLMGNVFMLQLKMITRFSVTWQISLGWSVVLGAVLLFFGGVMFASAGWFSAARSRRGRAVWLAGLMMGFPITFMFPLFYLRRWALFTPLPLGIFTEYHIPESLSYGLGLVWLLVVGWFVSCKENEKLLGKSE